MRIPPLTQLWVPLFMIELTIYVRGEEYVFMVFPEYLIIFL